MTPSASTTADLNDHVAAAAYLMKHRGMTVLVVLDGERADRPMGIITNTGIDLAAAHGKDLNKIRIQELIPQSPDRHQRGDDASVTSRSVMAEQASRNVAGPHFGDLNVVLGELARSRHPKAAMNEPQSHPPAWAVPATPL